MPGRRGKATERAQNAPSVASPRRGGKQLTNCYPCPRTLLLPISPAVQFARAYDKAMDLNLTAVFQKVPEGYIGFVEELPGANTQGATLEEARANLQEAVALVLEANRDLIGETTHGGDVIREPLKVGA